MSTEAGTVGKTHPFQAEVAQLLRLMVHSVYSETEIFLRELVSNASDACDKLRYEAIAKPELVKDGIPLAIRIKPDKQAGTLTIADTGIGMDRQELIDNLGTVARSGTRAFIEKLAESKDGAGLIGQFGVGFYSAFMVADRIEVTSRRAGAAEAYVWTSTGGEGFEIAPASEQQGARVPQGTEIVLHLKEDAKRYLEAHEIEHIIHTYSDHILFPIELVTEEEPRQINKASAIWQRAKSELKPEDYTQAYRSIATAFDEPAMTLHYRAEGRQSYAVLLFAPSVAPYDLLDRNRKGHVKLYVRRVFITEDTELLPPYLRFVRGVVDSEDLPLNISREMLQNHPQVAQIRKALTGRVVTELEQLAAKETSAGKAQTDVCEGGGEGAKPDDAKPDDGKPDDGKPDDGKPFAKIWDAFGAVLKEGIYEDSERRTQLLALARFTTTAGSGRSLREYVAGFKPNQTEIYYLVGDSIERLKSNPKLEAARARGIEVLLLTDPVDAFWTEMPLDFDGKPLKSLSRGEVDFSLVPLAEKAAKPGEDDKEKAVLDDATVVATVKLALGDRVSDVRVSQRLTDSAACLVAGGSGPDRELERLLARHNRAAATKPVLEINMRHILVKALARAKTEERETDIADLSALLLEEAQILDGEVPQDAAAFTARLNRLIMRGLAA
jgi:molecular chaperone HtpG